MNPQAPWWLKGDQRCEHCFQLYVLELEHRCAFCDGPVCPHCAVLVRERALTLCPDCRE